MPTGSGLEKKTVVGKDCWAAGAESPMRASPGSQPSKVQQEPG